MSNSSIWMGRSDNTHLEGGSAQPNPMQDRGIWQGKGNSPSVAGSVASDPNVNTIWMGSTADGKIPVSKPIAQAGQKPASPRGLHPDATTGMWSPNDVASSAKL